MSLPVVLPILNTEVASSPRKFKHRLDLDNLDDLEFYQRFQLRKGTFWFVMDEIRSDLSRTSQSSTAASPEIQLLCALRFYSTGGFLNLIGDSMGVDKATVSRAIRDVSFSLLNRLDKYVYFPTNHHDLMDKFYDIAQFPGVVGAIDGTQIRIQAPSGEQEPYYVNRKGFHSINVQAICDSNGRFLNIVADWPGSTHDSRILSSSAIGAEFQSGRQRGILVGDSGYPCKSWLMTPILVPRDLSEQRYNRSHKTTRCIIERTFGRWKRKFHVLHSEIRMSPKRVCRIIAACGVLHNIYLQHREPFDEEENYEVDSGENPISETDGSGQLFRRNFLQQHF